MSTLLLMFVPQTFSTLRFVAIGMVVGLMITVATAFTFAPSDLPFTNGPAAPTTDTAPTLVQVGEFAAPIEVIERFGDDRFFVVSLLGSIVASNGTTGTTVLDISELTEVVGERGLLGATFSPAGDMLYVHYSNLDGDSVLAEYRIDEVTAIADPTSARQLLVVDQPYDNHNGGEIDFGPDGYLYAGFGDGGLANDPNRSALDLSSPLGKILRIDPTPSADLPYTIPADNPFVDTPGADPTIWSYGLRNPWKFSFDVDTDALWIADVGQDSWEEINVATADDGAAGRGLSFGWSAFEGNERFNEDQSETGHTDPFFTYQRGEGRCSISGGTVYRGDTHPELDGWYIYGDYCTGEILAFDIAASDADREIIELGVMQGVVAVAAGPGGEVYVASVAGPVLRLS